MFLRGEAFPKRSTSCSAGKSRRTNGRVAAVVECVFVQLGALAATEIMLLSFWAA